MNQTQRKFLLDEIEKQYRKEKEDLGKRKPKPPSLNNYLIAAILDGSFKLRDSSTIRDALRERVRNLGKDESLLGSGNSWRRSEDEENMVLVPAELLFERTPGYAESLEEYSRAKAGWSEELNALEASIGAMRIKIQIGSDRALEALVEQADKLCSMSLTASNQLLLGGSK